MKCEQLKIGTQGTVIKIYSEDGATSTLHIKWDGMPPNIVHKHKGDNVSGTPYFTPYDPEKTTARSRPRSLSQPQQPLRKKVQPRSRSKSDPGTRPESEVRNSEIDAAASNGRRLLERQR